MILLLAFVVGALLVLVSFVQLLYLESLRLIPREFAALTFFKETLERKLRLETERGALEFSLLKHSLLVVCGAALPVVALVQEGGWLGLVEGFAAAWLVMLGASYLAPQALYRRTSGLWVLPLVPLVRVLAYPMKPLAIFLEFLHKLFEIGLAGPETGASDETEEIKAYISAGEEEGILEKDDSRFIANVVAFGDKRVRAVMTPRPMIVGIDISKSVDDLRKLAREQQYSRIVLYEGSIDHPRGYVHVRDAWVLEPHELATSSLTDLRRKLDCVPETLLVSELLKTMQAEGQQMVGVASEYGGLAGLVTMEDLVEEIFGEIRDEHEPDQDVVEEGEGVYQMSGNCDADHLFAIFEIARGEDSTSATVGGLVSEWHGGVPKIGEVVESHGLRLEVMAADDFRVDRVRVSAQKAPAAPEQETE